MKIAVFGRPFRKGFEDTITTFFRMMAERKVEIVIYKPFHEFLSKETGFSPVVTGQFQSHDDLKGNADYLFSFGGDGTFLETVSIVRDYGIPVIGVNTGRLGFLANISPDQIESSVEAVLADEIEIEHRSLIEVDDGSGREGQFNYALNEVSVQKKLSYMISIHTHLDDSFLNSFWADGLIVSTPTGSTAYSLSVGGPIISPDSNNFIISPLASHNLTNRPIIVPDSSVIRLRVDAGEPEVLLTLDSRSMLHPTGTEILIKRAPFTLKTVRLRDYTFYDTLRNKLMWGVDKRN